jgi:hypothetical protein
MKFKFDVDHLLVNRTSRCLFLNLDNEIFQSGRVILAQCWADSLQNQQNKLNIFFLKTYGKFIEDAKQQGAVKHLKI